MDSIQKEILDNLKILKDKAGELAVCAGIAEVAIAEGWSNQTSGPWRKNYDNTCRLAREIHDLLGYFKLL